MTEETPKQETQATVYELILYAFNLLTGYAWQAMGYVVNPTTGKTEVNLEEAKIAIDCADFLAGKLSTHVEPEVRKEVERVLRDLKLNYVSRSAEAGKEA